MTDEPIALETFWEQYLATLPEDAPHPPLPEAWHFCDSEPCANELGELVLAGTKTATASLLWVYEAEDERLPQVGDISLITDWDGSPLCVVETTSVLIKPFDEVDPQHAYDEGEGDRSLAFWRDVHWRFFARESAAIEREPTQQMPVVCERFRVLYPVP